jgi:anthranilate synthase component 1
MYSNWSYLVGLQGFKGDEFNVYRALRSINPSLIYSFLIMGFKIFGSSPEAQIIVKTKPKSILLQELLKEQVMMKKTILAKELSEDKKKIANT